MGTKGGLVTGAVKGYTASTRLSYAYGGCPWLRRKGQIPCGFGDTPGAVLPFEDVYKLAGLVDIGKIIGYMYESLQTAVGAGRVVAFW